MEGAAGARWTGSWERCCWPAAGPGAGAGGLRIVRRAAAGAVGVSGADAGAAGAHPGDTGAGAGLAGGDGEPALEYVPVADLAGDGADRAGEAAAGHGGGDV